MADISKIGGADSTGVGGGVKEEKTPPATIQFDPDHYVTSSFRTLEGYVLNVVDSDLYEIQFGFPSADDIGRWMPLAKTLIHFDIDNITNPPLGFGDSIVDTEYDDTDLTIIESEAQQHIFNWDIGIWASARSGGVTSRLETYEILNNLFVGPSAFFNLKSLGMEIQSFNGGSFIKEEIDNVSVYRVVNMTLVTRVFSRRLVGPTPYIEQIVTTPQVTVDGDSPNVIIQDG